MSANQTIEKKALIFMAVPTAQEHSFKINTLKNLTRKLFFGEKIPYYSK